MKKSTKRLICQQFKLIDEKRSGVEGAKVTYRGENMHTAKTIRIRSDYTHTVRFNIKWEWNHYIVVFVNGDGSVSQAVVAIWTIRDAQIFSNTCIDLLMLRAMRVENEG